jgi:tetratricopeptide (TPR) repeat protein
VAAVLEPLRRASAPEPAAGGPTSVEQVFLATTVLGGALPPDAERHLRAAGLNYPDDAVAERHLAAAAALAPDHAAVLIGRYRYFFYKVRWAQALAVAEQCLVWAARHLGLPADWTEVRRSAADFDDYDAVLARFYLFTLKGYAYLHLRLGQLGEGQQAARKLLELDPADRIGGQVLLDVLLRLEQGDDDD